MDARSARVARRFEPWLLLAALLVIPVMVIEQSEFGGAWATAASLTNWSIWLAFVAEAVTMLAIVPDRRRWLRDHPLEVAIVVLTPPFLSSLLQGLRAARLLRLVRVLRLGRLVTGSRRLFTMEGLRWAGMIGVIVILGGGGAFVAVENDPALSTWDGLWWAFTTATTVGYGDLYPHTDAGRAIAMVVMAVGIGLIALMTAAIAERFVRTDITEATTTLEADGDTILAEVTHIQTRLRTLEELLRTRRSESG